MLLAVSCDANGGGPGKRRVILTQRSLMAVKLSLVLNPQRQMVGRPDTALLDFETLPQQQFPLFFPPFVQTATICEYKGKLSLAVSFIHAKANES